MNSKNQINEYINSQTDLKKAELEMLHQIILEIMPACKLWFLDGKNNEGKIISNPNIGYGTYTIHYANGSNREFYQIGLSGNTTGISVYIMGISDKKILATMFKENIGKASISGYCIKFKSLKDININVLKEAIIFGLSASNKS